MTDKYQHIVPHASFSRVLTRFNATISFTTLLPYADNEEKRVLPLSMTHSPLTTLPAAPSRVAVCSNP